VPPPITPRIFRRVPYHGEIRFRAGDAGDYQTAVAENISLGGAFVRTPTPAPEGAVIRLEFRLVPGGEPIRGRARVIWRSRGTAPGPPEGMGLRFLELTPGSREQIFRLVDHHVRRGGLPLGPQETVSEPQVPPAPWGAALPAEPPFRLDAMDADATAGGPPAGAPGADDTVAAMGGVEPASVLDDGPGEEERVEPGAPRREAPETPEPPENPDGPPLPSLLAAYDEVLLPPTAVDVPPDDLTLPGVRRRGRGGSARRRLGAAPIAAIAAGAVVVLAAGGAYLHDRRVERRRAAAATPAAAPAASAPAAGPGAPPAAATPAPGAGDTATRPATRPPAPPDPAPAPAAGAATAPERPASSLPPAGDARPAPAPGATAATAGPPARRVEGISWRVVGEATEVEVRGDGRLDLASVARSHLGGANPRELLRLRGIVATTAPAVVAAGTPQLARVRSGHHPELEPDELHVVLDLAGPGVRVAAVEAAGATLLVRLEGR
jgi:uncharacterized protein (TIGR02266 family)